MQKTILRIRNAVFKVLPFAKVYIDKGSDIIWIDIVVGNIMATIEYHNDEKFGICVSNPKDKFLNMASYYTDNYLEAVDLAIKLLVD